MNFVDSVFRSKLLTYKDHVFKDMIRGRDEVLGSPKHENVEVVMRNVQGDEIKYEIRWIRITK